MRELEERIRRDGVVEDGDVLKVDGFLNHQMDVELFAAMGREWARLFAGEGVNKILTIEASGIGMACIAAQQFGVPVVFAKKSRTKNIAGDVYKVEVTSFTHGGVSDVIVSKRFLGPDDRLLLIDDFLANGAALEGLIDLAHQGRRSGGGDRRGKSLPARRGAHPRQRRPGGVAGPGQVHGAGADRILLRPAGGLPFSWKRKEEALSRCEQRGFCPSGREAARREQAKRDKRKRKRNF